MALRGGKRLYLKDFKGLQTFASKQNVDPNYFFESDSVIVTNDGSAACLRSPNQFSATVTGGAAPSGVVFSAFDYAKSSGHMVVFDINLGNVGVNSVATYITTNGTASVQIRSNQTADAYWVRETANDWCYGLNGTEFKQHQGTSTFYAVGINSSSVIATGSCTSGGAGTLTSGVTISYAYRNSTTGHVSQPSPASLTITSGGIASAIVVITFGTTTQTGVDSTVLFSTEDGGAARFLVVDNTGTPVNLGTSGSASLTVNSLVSVDTLTPETIYNGVPPQLAYYMFKWRDRLCLLDFRTATTQQFIQYSALESCYYGIPTESWPPLNIIAIPAKGDAARSGIETPVGALILAENDAYLIRGELSDKTLAPEASISVTESLQPLGWSIGTRSPRTLVHTPYGAIWLDQNKRIQMWGYEGFPQEIGLPIRTTLNRLADTDALRRTASATWFQFGDNGGCYVLVGASTGTGDTLIIISVYKDPESGEQKIACAYSDLGANCVFVANISGTTRCFAGYTGAFSEILDLDVEGDGFLSTQQRYFSLMLGNDEEWCYWHSIRFDATSTCGLHVYISNMDDSDRQEVYLEQDGSSGVTSYYGLLDQYGFRKKLRFEFDSRDGESRIILNLRVAYAPKPRLL